jgi:hypothetical protein
LPLSALTAGRRTPKRRPRGCNPAAAATTAAALRRRKGGAERAQGWLSLRPDAQHARNKSLERCPARFKLDGQSPDAPLQRCGLLLRTCPLRLQAAYRVILRLRKRECLSQRRLETPCALPHPAFCRRHSIAVACGAREASIQLPNAPPCGRSGLAAGGELRRQRVPPLPCLTQRPLQGCAAVDQGPLLRRQHGPVTLSASQPLRERCCVRLHLRQRPAQTRAVVTA